MRKRVCATLLVALCLYGTIDWGASIQGHPSERVNEMKLLTASQVKRTLRRLPYRFDFRAVALPARAYSAVAGAAFGRHRTVVNFGISFGRVGGAVPVPRAGTDSTFTYHNLFVYTDDLQWRNAKGKLVTPSRMKTGAQWREASRISVDITDRLCLTATGAHCPV